MLTPFSSDVLILPEPNAYECVISAHIFASATPAEVQGINLEEWRARNEMGIQKGTPVFVTDGGLNSYLQGERVELLNRMASTKAAPKFVTPLERNGLASCFVYRKCALS